MTPWIALAPDISGVCRVVETLDTTSKPMNTERTKTVSSAMLGHVATPSRTAPSRVTQQPATISSSQSGATTPSVVMSSSRSVTLRA